MQTPTRAERFRARVAEVYDLDALGPADFEALDEIAYQMDVLDQVRAALRGAPLLDRRQGGDRPNPLLVEDRLRSAALAQALARWPVLAEE